MKEGIRRTVIMIMNNDASEVKAWFTLQYIWPCDMDMYVCIMKVSIALSRGKKRRVQSETFPYTVTVPFRRRGRI